MKRKQKTSKTKLRPLRSFLVFIGACAIVVPLAILLSDEVNISSNLPKGYCKVQNVTLAIGGDPAKVTIDDTKRMVITLVDIKQGTVAYFVNEEVNPQTHTFKKVTQTKNEDTKLWQDSVLLRTTNFTVDGSSLMIAKKCK